MATTKAQYQEQLAKNWLSRQNPDFANDCDLISENEYERILIEYIINDKTVNTQIDKNIKTSPDMGAFIGATNSLDLKVALTNEQASRVSKKNKLLVGKLSPALEEIEQTASMAEVVSRKFEAGSRHIGGAGMAIARRHAELVRQERTNQIIQNVIRQLGGDTATGWKNALNAAGDAAIGVKWSSMIDSLSDVAKNYIEDLANEAIAANKANPPVPGAVPKNRLTDTQIETITRLSTAMSSMVGSIANARSQAVQAAVGSVQRIIASALESAQAGDGTPPRSAYFG